MSLLELLSVIGRLVGFLINLAVCGAAVRYYLQTPKHCFGLIGLSAVLGALCSLCSRFTGDLGSVVLYLADLLLWAVGFFMLLADYVNPLQLPAQPSAPPIGGSTVQKT